jgi:formylmethanofuran dehydrogenase subunit E
MIESDDLVGLLHKTAQLHGHHCVGSAMGVIAANHTMKTMRIVRNTGMEHLVAVVETNSCFSDARAKSPRSGRLETRTPSPLLFTRLNAVFP